MWEIKMKIKVLKKIINEIKVLKKITKVNFLD